MSGRQRVELPSYEALAKLAVDDPEAYEALRRKVLDSFIDNAPARIKPRLQGIQFRVEAMRRLSRSALGSTVKVYELMWQSFLHLNDCWQEVVHAKAGHPVSPAKSCLQCDSARILEYRPRVPKDQG